MLQILNEDGVDELVLRHRLHHEHALLAQVREHLGHVHVQVVVDAVEEDVAEERHARPPHARRAVHQHRRVAVYDCLARHVGRGVPPQRRHLAQELDEVARVARAAVVRPVRVLQREG